MTVGLCMHSDVKSDDITPVVLAGTAIVGLSVLYKYCTVVPSKEMILQANNYWTQHSSLLQQQYYFSVVSEDFSRMSQLLQQELQIQSLHKQLASRYFWDGSVALARDNMATLISVIEGYKSFKNNVFNCRTITNRVYELQGDQRSAGLLLARAQVCGSRLSAYPLVSIVSQIRQDMVTIDKFMWSLSGTLFSCQDSNALLELKALLSWMEEVLVLSPDYTNQLQSQELAELEARRVEAEERRARAEQERAYAEQKKAQAMTDQAAVDQARYNDEWWDRLLGNNKK